MRQEQDQHVRAFTTLSKLPRSKKGKRKETEINVHINVHANVQRLMFAEAKQWSDSPSQKSEGRRRLFVVDYCRLVGEWTGVEQQTVILSWVET